MENQAVAQKAVAKLLELCHADGVHVPTDPMSAIIHAGNILVATHRDGDYHLDDALAEMTKRFGASKSKRHKKPKGKDAKGERQHASTTHEKGASSPKHDDGSDHSSDDDNADRKSAGQKKRENLPATNPNNQPLAKLFTELAGFEYKRGDSQKGTAHMHIAKVIREADDEITSGKHAMTMRGIGQATAAKIDEYLVTGRVEELEDFKAGKL